MKKLKAVGLTRIHVGFESGAGAVLDLMKKGVTPEEQVTSGRRVMDAGISLCEYVLLGLGGRRYSKSHATESARVLSHIDPDHIRVRTLAITPQMPLWKKWRSGEFQRLTDTEIIMEEKILIENLKGIHTSFVSDHILNLLEDVEGRLPAARRRMIAVIDDYLSLPREEQLHFMLGRRMGLYRSLEDLKPGRRDSRVDSSLRVLMDKYPDSVEEYISTMLSRFI
jgi:hypothetical protein